LDDWLSTNHNYIFRAIRLLCTFFIFAILFAIGCKGAKPFVPVDVNEVAAQSQKPAALSEHETLEPGSNLWIARQAYLKLMEKTFRSEKPEDLRLIQARYKLLQQLLPKTKNVKM